MSQHLLVKSMTPTGGTAQEIGTVTVLVGPNNSGKSEALRDLVRLAGNFEPSGEERPSGDDRATVVLQDVAFVSKLSLDRLLRGITTLDGNADEGKVVHGLSPNLRSPFRRPLAADLKNILFRPILTARSVAMTSLGNLMPLRVAYLPAENRANLIEPGPVGSPLRAPEHLLAALQDAPPPIHEQLDRALGQILNGSQHLLLDPTERSQLSLRISSNPVPNKTGDPIQDAIALQSLRLVGREGDGIRNCAAIVLTMLVCQGRLIVIDRPDTGLQPEVSRSLGEWIAGNAVGLGCQVVVASSDPSFLSGLYAGTPDVLIWRVSRCANVTRFEPVPAEVGKALATFPLFTAQNAIQCLSRSGVVVSPSAADAVVYQAVADRLLRGHNISFLHAHGTRNLPFVTKALRRASLPTCVVSDLDLFQSELLLTDIIKALSNHPPPAPWLATRERLASHVEGRFDEKSLSATSNEVESFLDQFKQGTPQPVAPVGAAPPLPHSRWDRLRKERLSALPPELRIWVEELIEDLKRTGLFVSPKGHLQNWIAFTADSEDPDGWLNRAMQVLHSGDCPAELRAFVAEMVAFLKPSV